MTWYSHSITFHGFVRRQVPSTLFEDVVSIMGWQPAFFITLFVTSDKNLGNGGSNSQKGYTIVKAIILSFR